MRNFKYIARDRAGERQEGIFQAVCQDDVLMWTRNKGLIPISVHEIIEDTVSRKKALRIRHVKAEQISSFCWQLTTMLEGGVSITEALETIADDMDNITLSEALEDISESVKSGQTLSESLAEHPRIFGVLFRAMTLAGEMSGSLPTVLRRMATFFENRDKLIRQVRGALAYPMFVIGFVILLVVVMATFVIPQFLELFEVFDNELPAFTQAFLVVYEGLRDNIIVILLVIITIVTTIVFYNRTKGGHRYFSKLLLRIPLTGKLMKQAFYAIFTRTTSTLLSSGVSMLEALEIMRDMSKNDIIREAVQEVHDQIVEGENISDSMRKAGFFSNIIVKMVQVGEQSGSLPGVLDKTSDYYERKIESTIEMLTKVMEPIMIVMVGAIVLVVLIALYMPIFSMSA